MFSDLVPLDPLELILQNTSRVPIQNKKCAVSNKSLIALCWKTMEQGCRWLQKTSSAVCKVAIAKKGCVFIMRV